MEPCPNQWKRHAYVILSFHVIPFASKNDVNYLQICLIYAIYLFYLTRRKAPRVSGFRDSVSKILTSACACAALSRPSAAFRPSDTAIPIFVSNRNRPLKLLQFKSPTIYVHGRSVQTLNSSRSNLTACWRERTCTLCMSRKLNGPEVMSLAVDKKCRGL